MFQLPKTGQQANQCKDTPTCSKCGDTQQPQDCKDLGYTQSIRRCIHCVNQDKLRKQAIDLYDEKYHHSALSQKCPICQTEIQDLTLPLRLNG
ncbi:hypothetical protein O181_027256 [Austropuccinia psidii MF-1]|uniref:Uncharacterized protein n=1 Tax=Austropuccinia psidii MF-1 TaxID=1389203 RepID=A0A9Q3H1A0_9BASI|nr:hypothetical protein [Austropuccinia psidii MF-1]